MIYACSTCAPDLTNMVEQPAEHADGASGWLATHTRPGLTTADRYAWLTDAGPLSGRLNLESDAGAACKLETSLNAKSGPALTRLTKIC